MIDKLEDMLKRATEKPEYRNSFYHLLLQENLYVPVNSDIPEGAATFSKPGEKDFTWAVANIGGRPTVPAFTSQKNVEEFFAKMDGWEGRYIISKGRDLLTSMSESEFLCLEINPASQFGVGLPPDMIKELVS